MEKHNQSHHDKRNEFRDTQNRILIDDLYREADTGDTLRIVGHTMDRSSGEVQLSYVDTRQPEVIWSMSAEKFLGKITLEDGSEVAYHEPTRRIY